MERQTQIHIWYVIAAVLAVIWLRDLWVASQRVEEISYSAFQQALNDGSIQSVEVDGASLRGTYRKPTAQGAERFVTPRVDIDLAPELAFFVIWIFVFRRVADRDGLGGMLAIGKSKARVYVETDIKVTFEDVAGVDEAKAELREIVEF